jgi:hypothetical protein
MENLENLGQQTQQEGAQVQPQEAVEAPQTTPEQPAEKTYSQKEMTEAVESAVKRSEARLHRRYNREYGPLMEVLKAGTGKENTEEITEDFRKYYSAQGAQVPKEGSYSQKDAERLAKADAEEIIGYGMEEVVAEMDRLVKKGPAKMTPREKVMFNTLAEYRNRNERTQQLQAMGVTDAEINSGEFQAFAGQFTRSTPIQSIYELYRAQKPKKEVHTAGSMVTPPATESTLKDFYTPEEAKKFTAKDLREIPGLEQRLWDSARRWRK